MHQVARHDRDRIPRQICRARPSRRRLRLVSRPHRLVAQHQHLPRSALGARAGDLWRGSLSHLAHGRRLHPRPAGRRSPLFQDDRHLQAFRGAQRPRIEPAPRGRPSQPARPRGHLSPGLPRDGDGGDVQSVMCAYNAVDGVPGCANRHAARGPSAPRLGLHAAMSSPIAAPRPTSTGPTRSIIRATPEEGVAARLQAPAWT